MTSDCEDFQVATEPSLISAPQSMLTRPNSSQEYHFRQFATTDTVEIRIGDRIFYANKIALSSVSEFFKKPFASDNKSKPISGVYHLYANPTTFQYLLDYSHTGSYPLLCNTGKDGGFNLDKYATILAQATYFGIDRLAKWIKEEKFLDAVSVSLSTKIREYYGHESKVPFVEPRRVSLLNDIDYKYITWDIKSWVCPYEMHQFRDRCKHSGCEGRWEYLNHGSFVEVTRTVEINLGVCIDPKIRNLLQIDDA